MRKPSLWLIGAGPMAQAYAKVLQDLDVPFSVIGRGETSASVFQQATGISVRQGGLDQSLHENGAPDAAIVAVSVEQLASAATALIRAGSKRILLEKPGGIDQQEIQTLYELADASQTNVLIAYNRRFYASVQKARECIEEDGGLLSAQFEFTEWSHKIGPLEKGPGVKEHWLLGNSTHVIDLAFHLCGQPDRWHGWHAGSLEWHPAAARFCGAGITEQGVLFSYLADWQAPGRWGLELLTAKRRLILRPMEELQAIALGTIKVEPVEIDDSLDKRFKPGLYKQTLAFIESEDTYLTKIGDHAKSVTIYSEIAGY